MLPLNRNLKTGIPQGSDHPSVIIARFCQNVPAKNTATFPSARLGCSRIPNDAKRIPDGWHGAVPGFEIDASRLRYQATGPNEFGLRLRGASLINVVVPMKAN